MGCFKNTNAETFVFIPLFGRSTKYCFTMNHDRKIAESERLVNIAV